MKVFEQGNRVKIIDGIYTGLEGVITEVISFDLVTPAMYLVKDEFGDVVKIVNPDYMVLLETPKTEENVKPDTITISRDDFRKVAINIIETDFKKHLKEFGASNVANLNLELLISMRQVDLGKTLEHELFGPEKND